MKVVFRTDASLQIGIGHVMRCLTLAEALIARGAECQFICRAHKGNLIEVIRRKGFFVHVLPIAQDISDVSTLHSPELQASAFDHRDWLGTTQTQDSEVCAPILAAERPHWLIVDHYALDARWETSLAPYYSKLMVIDDLADRPHVSDMLVDQTFGRDAEDYRFLVPADCCVLCGSQYVLLRPEFMALRTYSLQRRSQPALRELLITMGGVDINNTTGQVLRALRTCPLHPECRITVVMGATAPWLHEVHAQVQDMPWQSCVLVDVSDMAQLMADSDLVIGAAGTTSWERCCLGVPTIMLVLAENQLKVAEGLELAGAAVLLTPGLTLEYQLPQLLASLASEPQKLHAMSKFAATIVDGTGIHTIATLLEL